MIPAHLIISTHDILSLSVRCVHCVFHGNRILQINWLIESYCTVPHQNQSIDSDSTHTSFIEIWLVSLKFEFLILKFKLIESHFRIWGRMRKAVCSVTVSVSIHRPTGWLIEIDSVIHSSCCIFNLWIFMLTCLFPELIKFLNTGTCIQSDSFCCCNCTCVNWVWHCHCGWHWHWHWQWQ